MLRAVALLALLAAAAGAELRDLARGKVEVGAAGSVPVMVVMVPVMVTGCAVLFLPADVRRVTAEPAAGGRWCRGGRRGPAVGAVPL